MSNIKFSGIESSKYGLTARWFGDKFYGNDTDVDAVGYYHPTTNPSGFGGPQRPFASLDKFNQDANVADGATIVLGPGHYSIASLTKPLIIVGDGIVDIWNSSIRNSLNASNDFYNLNLVNCTLGNINTIINCVDAKIFYGSFQQRTGIQKIVNSSFVEVAITACEATTIKNCTLVNCSGNIGSLGSGQIIDGLLAVNCSNLILYTTTTRPSGNYKDYSVIIGTIRSNRSINGKTTGVTIEDFKVDGNYFVRSFSEVDLFGNASGTGASVAQLQSIFNNYFSPIYLDSWMYADFSLKPNVNEKIRFGGLNGSFIGMRPVGYHYNAVSLWTNRNISNTFNVEIDVVTNYLQIISGVEYGVLETNELNLGAAFIIDPIIFRANLVYNADGTAKQGVANQRIDTTVDLLPDNTKNQRVVYDYELAYASDATSPLSEFKKFELNRKPTVDANGYSQLDDNYNAASAQAITIWRFKLRITLRKVVIE